MAPSFTPLEITITAGSSQLNLTDVLVGDVYVCSGQSNMQLNVLATVNGTSEAAAASRFTTGLRLMQVAMLPTYFNVSSPQANLSASIPWSKPTVSAVAAFSATCYYYAAHALERRPKMPIGLIASSWGGTAIEPWMSPSALDKCGEPPTVPTSQTYWRRSPSDPGLSATAVPSVPSTLFNSMIAPLLVLRVTGWLWYQGESNSLQPQRYACLFPALIAQWRADWAAGSEYAEPTVRPFLFVQLAPWPDGDVGSIAGTRYAQLAALALPSVGMVVAADLGDAAGANHPIHPPWKQELGRRAALVAESVVFKNQHAWAQGPLVTAVHWDEWQPTWGADHFGSNPGGGVCANGGGHGWRCGGIRVTFDRPITLRNVGCTSAAFAATSAWAVGGQGGGCAALGSGGGFTLWNDRNGTEGQGTLGPTGETLTSSQCTHCDHCPCAQPLQIYGVLDDAVTLQLNVTFISGTPRTLKYAWSDYPSMSVFDADPADGRPAPPFNATIAIEVERPNAGTQRVSAR